MSGAPPNLLNDDGSASVATALMMSHHGFRRDLARFAQALSEFTQGRGEQSRIPALKEEWQNYRGTLHGHHQAEDAGIFPNVRKEKGELAAVIEGLIADHHEIDPLLQEGDQAFAKLPDGAPAAAAVIARLASLLGPHLAKEEAEIIPVLRNWKGFPPPASDAEVNMFATGFAWSSHGVADEICERVYATLPNSVSSKLPAARAAFAERTARVWGAQIQSGASRTSIPDWLASR